MTRNVRTVAVTVAVAVVALIGLPALVVSTAWLSGLPEPDHSPADADYLWRPLDISDRARLALGLAATVLAAGAIVLLWRWFKAGRITRTVMIVLTAIAAIAAYAGVTYGAATAPEIGANIGGGLMLLAAGPFVAVTIVVAVVAVVQQRRRTAVDRGDLQA